MRAWGSLAAISDRPPAPVAQLVAPATENPLVPMGEPLTCPTILVITPGSSAALADRVRTAGAIAREVTDLAKARQWQGAPTDSTGILIEVPTTPAATRLALTVLRRARAAHPTLPVAVVSAALSESVCRAAARPSARTLLVPVSARELGRFVADVRRAQPVTAALTHATLEVATQLALAPQSRPVEVLLARVLGRDSAEVCEDLGIKPSTYWSHMKAITARARMPIADLIRLIIRRAQGHPVTIVR